MTRLERLHGRRALAAAFVLGLLSALALPPVHVVPVLLLSIPGLLVLAGAAPGWKRAGVIGLVWGWGHFIGGLYWLTHAILTEVERFWWLVPIAVPALALPLALFVVAPVALARCAPAGSSRILVFAGAWVLSEIARGVLFTGFPWNLMGSIWAFDPLALQGAAWIGVHGLSLITVLVAASPLLGWRGMAGATAVLAGFGLFGWLRLTDPGPPPRDVALVLVQANIAQEVKWREDARPMILRRYLDMTRAAVAEAVATLPPGQRIVVVWPEAAVPYLLADDPEIRRLVSETLSGQAILLAGSARAEFGPDGRARRVFNSLVALDAEGQVLATYDKAHLVPFGEYMPLQGLLPVRLVPGSMDFTPGPGLATLTLPGLPAFGPLICYEVIFPGSVVATARPDWLVNVTNDAWYGVSAGPYQHLAAARLRAIEEGLPLVRAAQTGVSAVFDAYGRTQGHIPLGETGVLFAQLPSPAAPTLFARIGIWLPGLLALLVLVAGWTRGMVGRRGARSRPAA
ncbi:MAG TPA: apolipoprotein N-acyltransferase [Acetobacteraceae bacterium]|nr:apolipoprotein N-acyltransferase [Acetobacteraceae bacterium]